MRSLLLGTMSAAAAGVVVAQTWTGPDLQRRPGLMNRADVDFMVSEICFPYLLTGADPASFDKRDGVVKDRGHAAWNQGGAAYRVNAPQMQVVLTATGGTRDCTLYAGAGDPQKLKAALTARLAQWPTPLTNAAFQYPPNAYAERIFLCGPREGPHDTVLISVGGRPGAGTAALAVTIMRSEKRSERCDGVAPSAETLSMNAPVAIETLGRLARACREVVAGRPPDEAFAGVDRPSPLPRLDDPSMGALAVDLRRTFGADAQVSLVRAPGTTGFAFVSQDGARCRVDLRAAARFDEAVSREVLGWDGWRSAGRGNAKGPAEATLSWRVVPGPNPLQTVVLEFRRRD